MDTFLLNLPLELELEEEKYMLAVTKIEVHNSFFKLTEHNNTFAT